MSYVLGIDVGGTKIAGILMNAQGRVLARERRATEATKGRKHVLANIIAVVAKLQKKKIDTIGMGVPGIVNTEGKIVLMPNIPALVGFPLRRFLEQKLRVPVVVENDAKCFALAEYKEGAGRGTRTMIGLVWGTGIGAGLIVDRKLYRGAHGGAGEVGHIVLRPAARLVPGVTDWEAFCAGPKIVQRYYRAGGRMRAVTVEKIFTGHDQSAKKVREETIAMMSWGLANLATIIDPEVIVLGGGLSNMRVLSEVRRQVRRLTLAKDVKIVKEKLGEDAGMRGAAWMALQE